MPLVATIQSRTARREERLSTRAGAVCRRGSQREQVHILDISRHGARFTFLTRYRPAEHVWLRLPLLAPLEARIVWVNKLEAGCEFAAPLHPSIFAVISRTMASG